MDRTRFAFLSPPGICSIRRSGFLGSCTNFERLCRHTVPEQAVARRRLVVQSKRRNGGGGGRDRRRGDGRRPNRVGELIRRELSPIINDFLSRSFKSSKPVASAVLVSVVDVRCADDLRNATVSISVLGTDEQRQEVLRWLKSARKDLRFALAQAVYLKYMPDLCFEESEMSQAVKTVNVLNKLEREREGRKTGAASRGETDSVFSSISSTSLDSKGEDDMDLSDDGIIMDDLDGFEDEIDEDDSAEDAIIIDVDGGEESMEGLSDESVRDVLYKTLGKEEFKR